MSPNFYIKSVFFFTFHKCASSLFGGQILPKAEGFLHKNYTGAIYNKKNTALEIPEFKENLHIYGPLRLSGTKKQLPYRLFVFPAVKFCFKQNCNAVFLIRDPRDILISLYYHEKFNTRLSLNRTVADDQIARRKKVEKMGLDEFVLENAENYRRFFAKLILYRQRMREAVTLKYEDMIHNFNHFSKDLVKKIPLEDKILKNLFLKTRPKHIEEAYSHHRSGKTHQYIEKLEQKTQDKLKTIFSTFLKELNY